MSLNRVLIAVCEGNGILNNLSDEKLMTELGEKPSVNVDIEDGIGTWVVQIMTLAEFTRLVNKGDFEITEADYLRTVQYEVIQTVAYKVAE